MIPCADPAYRDFFVTVEGDPDLSAVVRPRALPLLTTFDPASGPRKVWTTFSADQVDLNFKNPDVFLAVLDALVQRTLAHGGFVSYKDNPDGSKTPYEMNVNYFDALSNPAGDEAIEAQVRRFLCAHAIQFSLAGVPGIYFHSLFGSRGDRASAETSGIPRRINRQKLSREELEHDLADPDSLRGRVFGGLKSLLQRRREHPAFQPTAAQRVIPCDPRVFAIARGGQKSGSRMLCLHNVSGEPVELLLKMDGTESTFHLAPYEVRWEAMGAGA